MCGRIVSCYFDKGRYNNTVLPMGTCHRKITTRRVRAWRECKSYSVFYFKLYIELLVATFFKTDFFCTFLALVRSLEACDFKKQLWLFISKISISNFFSKWCPFCSMKVYKFAQDEPSYCFISLPSLKIVTKIHLWECFSHSWANSWSSLEFLLDILPYIADSLLDFLYNTFVFFFETVRFFLQ